jgi:hypothetical protein
MLTRLPFKSLYVLCLFVFVLLPKYGDAQIKNEALLLKKNFYMLYLLEKNPEQNAFPILNQIASTRNKNLKNAIENCETSACLVKALNLTDLEIRQIGDQLIGFASENKSFLDQLRASKYAISFDSGIDSSLVRKTWETNARAMNRILAVYINGEKPLYPKIDATSFESEDKQYFEQLKSTLKHLLDKDSSNASSPYHTLMRASLKVLLLNGRDEAVRYEPLDKGLNKGAVRQISKIDWAKFPYSVILVPGLGPEQEGLRLDPNGAKRCDSAAIKYFAGLAPFIVVSGGHVHPNKTPYAEAVEMKKYLVKVLKVPKNAVIIEPHARHTTTNLRNVNRMVFRFSIPADKKILIVTDASQTTYIRGNMKGNVLRELGYLPFTDMQQVSDTETKYLPNEISMQANPFDPLDPE